MASSSPWASMLAGTARGHHWSSSSSMWNGSGTGGSVGRRAPSRLMTVIHAWPARRPTTTSGTTTIEEPDEGSKEKEPKAKENFPKWTPSAKNLTLANAERVGKTVDDAV